MASLAQSVRMSEEEFFRLLERSAHKYEYWDGFAVAMAGAQPEHVRIETNLIGELFGRLRGTDCLPLVSNQAVRLAGASGYVFPDATVVCGKPEYIVRQGIGCLVNPTVAVEVLSRSRWLATKLTNYSLTPSSGRSANIWWFPPNDP
jgi:Uma2 family endonuclease